MKSPMMLFKKLTMIPVIDAHVHVFPPKLYEAIRRWFETNAWSFYQQGTAEEFIQSQFDYGAAGLVLLNYAHRPGMADALNKFTAGLITRFPSTVGLAAVHPHDENPRDILARAFEKGLCGVKLHCHVQGVAPDDPLFFPIYETVLEFGGVVVIHAGNAPALPGYETEIRAITGADRVARVLERYPDLKMVVPHLGFDETEAFYELLNRYDNLYLDTAMVLADFFPVTIDRQGLIDHADRILYGTDFPHIPYETERELKNLLEMDIGEIQIRKILFENAAKLFQMKYQPCTGMF